MTKRSPKFLRISTLIIATAAALTLAAGVVNAEPSKGEGPRKANPAAKANGKPGAKHGKSGKGRRGARLLQRFDANRDGKLTKSEVPAKVWKRLSVADANGDQAVTRDEIKKARADGKLKRPGRARAFQRFDANRDGKLTKSEVPAKAWKRISVADADGDQAVTKAELQKARADGKLNRHKKGPRGQRGKARRG